MKLFAVTYSAMRDENNQCMMRVTNAVALGVGDDFDIHAQSFVHFPESEGWRDHQSVFTEIEQGMIFDGYQLTWHTVQV